MWILQLVITAGIRFSRLKFPCINLQAQQPQDPARLSFSPTGIPALDSQGQTQDWSASPHLEAATSNASLAVASAPNMPPASQTAATPTAAAEDNSISIQRRLAPADDKPYTAAQAAAESQQETKLNMLLSARIASGAIALQGQPSGAGLQHDTAAASQQSSMQQTSNHSQPTLLPQSSGQHNVPAITSPSLPSQGLGLTFNATLPWESSFSSMSTPEFLKSSPRLHVAARQAAGLATASTAGRPVTPCIAPDSAGIGAAADTSIAAAGPTAGRGLAPAPDQQGQPAPHKAAAANPSLEAAASPEQFGTAAGAQQRLHVACDAPAQSATCSSQPRGTPPGAKAEPPGTAAAVLAWLNALATPSTAGPGSAKQHRSPHDLPSAAAAVTLPDSEQAADTAAFKFTSRHSGQAALGASASANPKQASPVGPSGPPAGLQKEAVPTQSSAAHSAIDSQGLPAPLHATPAEDVQSAAGVSDKIEATAKGKAQRWRAPAEDLTPVSIRVTPAAAARGVVSARAQHTVMSGLTTPASAATNMHRQAPHPPPSPHTPPHPIAWSTLSRLCCAGLSGIFGFV